MASINREIWELYYTLLLKDLGCSSNAARICQLYLTDDLTFKHDFKQIDDSLSQALRFVLAHTGLKAGLAERFRAIIHIFKNGGEIARELIETRCHRGAEIARKMRFGERVALGIQNLDEHWDGGGKPTGAQGPAIPIYAQIALMAQVVDVFHAANGIEVARGEIGSAQGPGLIQFCRRPSTNWRASRNSGRRYVRRIWSKRYLRLNPPNTLRWSTRIILTTSPRPLPR